MKKGQIATEFLNTYAWAIVAVFVAIAALWMLGVFNAQPPRSCFLADGFSCNDFAVDASGRLHLDVGQGTGRAITVTGVGCSVNGTPAIISVPPVIIQNKEHAFITTSEGIECYGAQTSNLAFRGTVALRYRANDLTFNQTSKGDISTPFLSVTGGGSSAPTPTPASVPGIMSCTDAIYYIMTSGTYLLGSDLNSTTHICIQINADDTTLDCQGHTINGFDLGPTGVYGDHIHNITIQNCVVTGYGFGLLIGQVDSLRITGNSFSNNNQMGRTSYGMSIQDATNTVISGNDCSSNGGFGIQVTGSSSSNITGNTANNNGVMGFDIGTTSSCRFTGNTANYNGAGAAGPMYAGIYLNDGATNNVFENNVARWNKLYGIHNAFGNTGNNLSGNNFCNNNHTTDDTHCYTVLTATGSNSCRADSGCSIACAAC